jgi:hypothetical protein
MIVLGGEEGDVLNNERTKVSMKRRPPTAVGGVLGGKITGLPAGFLYKSFATPPLNGQVFGGVRKDANHNCLQFKNSICLETFHLPFKIATGKIPRK